MKTLELVQTAVIIILAAVVGVHLTTDVGHNTQNALPVSSEEKLVKSEVTQNADHQAVNYNNDNAESSKQVTSLTTLFKQVENSVVQITSKVSTVNAHIIINGNPLESQSTRLGSGFVYDTQGHIITNNHVVEGSETVDVTFVDGNTYTAKVVGADAYSDMAVLQITDNFSDESLNPVMIGNSFELEVGQ